MDLDFLHECLICNADGSLTWRQRPYPHFPDERAWKIWNTRWAGKSAGSFNKSLGYRQVTINNIKLYEHRVVFALTQGRWPDDQIDHQNRGRAENQLANLREATNSQNHQNIGLNSNNKSGARGVYWAAREGRWVAEIKLNYRKTCLGYFTALDDAVAARRRAEALYHPFGVEVA